MPFLPFEGVHMYNADGKELTLDRDAQKQIGNVVLIKKYPIRRDIAIAPEILQLNERKVTIVDSIKDAILFRKLHWRLDISFDDLLRIAEQWREDVDDVTRALLKLAS